MAAKPHTTARRKHKGGKVNRTEALALRAQDWTYPAIAEHFGVTKSAIYQQIAPFEEVLDEVLAAAKLADLEEELLRGIRMMLLQHVSRMLLKDKGAGLSPTQAKDLYREFLVGESKLKDRRDGVNAGSFSAMVVHMHAARPAVAPAALGAEVTEAKVLEAQVLKDQGAEDN